MSTNYVIPPYGPLGQIEVAPGAVDETYALKLVGRGAPGYGQAFAENTIRQLSNFANTTAPTKTSLIGQLWFDTTVNTMKVYTSAGWKPLFSEVSGGGTVQPSQGGTGLIPSSGDANKFLRVNTAGTGYVFVAHDDMVLRRDISTAPVSHNTIELGTAAVRFKTIYAETFDGVYISPAADLAERYETEEPVEAGDVVEMGGTKEIRKTSAPYSNDILGVISTNPSYLMNAVAGDDSTHPYVAMVGRVPVKVLGRVKKNQRLVSSFIPGVAVAASISEIANAFQVIGRALASKETDGVGLVEAVVGVK